MKSGLEGRNNLGAYAADKARQGMGLNEVRPRRPEQSGGARGVGFPHVGVSMKSGLEGRNNETLILPRCWTTTCLNEVRPRRPEQSAIQNMMNRHSSCLNEVRPRRPEQSEELRTSMDDYEQSQ